MIKRFTLSLLNVLWKTTAIIVVSAAVVVSVVRLLLPDIDRYREPIAAWVSRQVAQPVEFDTIHASWRGWTPVVELNNVRLLNADRSKIITRFARARFTLSPSRSLALREMAPGRLTVSGLQISLARSQNGVIRIEGGSPDETVPGLRQNPLAHWLQTQHQLIIEEAAITWHDQRLLKPLAFSNVTLLIRADGERRQVEGTASLPQAPGSRFRFLLDINGDLLTTAWSGAMFLDGKGIEPSLLLDYSRWLGMEASGGQLDFEVWSDWRQAKLTSVRGRFTAGNADIGTRARRVRVNALSGTVVAAREAAGFWQIAVDPLRVTTANGEWPEGRLAVRIERSTAQSQPSVLLNASFLRLEDLSPVITDIAVLPEAIREAVADLQPHGEVRDLRFGYDPDLESGRRAVIEARVDALHTAARDKLPGITGLSGQLTSDTRSGSVRLSGGTAEIIAPTLFHRPLAIEQAQGAIGWTREGEGWRISTQDLRVRNADLAITLRGQLALRPQEAPLLDLLANIEHADIGRLSLYLPRAEEHPRARAWLAQALAGGRIVDGGILVHGALDRFPFDAGDGRFQVHLSVADGQLDFHPRWPSVRAIDAQVDLTGRSIMVRAARAKTLDAEITNTVARIEDLSAPERAVIVDGKATGTTRAAKDYISATPLKDPLKPLQSLLADAGKLTLALDLHIPLSDERTTLNGTLGMEGMEVRGGAPAVELSAIAGTLHFTRAGFDAENVLGQHAGRPVNLALKGDARSDVVQTEMRISGRGTPAFLSDRLHALAPPIAGWLDRSRLLSRLRGETDWEIAAGTTYEKGSFALGHLRIASSLAGLELDLPSPLRKEAAPVRRLNIDVDLATRGARLVEVALGGDLRGALLLKDRADGSTALSRAALQFGGAPAQLPESDSIRIAGSVAEVSVSDWLDLLHERASRSQGAVGSSAPPLPVSLDVNSDRVEALGRVFDKVRIAGESGVQQWQLRIDGAQIEGEATVPHRLRQDITRVDLRRLAITPRAVEHAASVKIDPGRLPPVSIRCERFAYQDVDFGRAELSTRPIASGLRLESLTFDSPAAHIVAQGEWTYVDDIHASQFDIDAEAAELDRLLAQFGYGLTAVEGGRTNLDIKATWPGTPADFTLEKLRGSLSMTIKEGRFLDINNPATGRLFGLLSIQALPRRLNLDFADLFSKGMSFQRITGNFELDGGNAYTNNLAMEGSSARIEVTGRTGLAHKDYDQFATVTPQISDSLPVASALFGPAGAGVGAAIFLGKKIIPKLPEQIDRMLARQYTITGQWDSPVIEHIQRSPPDNNPLDSPIADG